MRRPQAIGNTPGVTLPLADEIPLELGEARDHVVHELGERSRRTAGPPQDREMDPCVFEPLLELHPMGHLAREAVDAGDDDDHVDAPLRAPRQELTKRRALEGPAAPAQIVEAFVEDRPSLLLHRPDVVFAPLALGFAGREFLLAARH